MDHKWLEDFIALAREKSFSKAAELRHITQQQFSRRIRSLAMWASGCELGDVGDRAHTRTHCRAYLVHTNSQSYRRQRLRLITSVISEGVTALEQGAADFLLSYMPTRALAQVPQAGIARRMQQSQQTFSATAVIESADGTVATLAAQKSSTAKPMSRISA